MKANTTFIFAGIMSAIIGNAYATGENIVTSKSYVDNTFQTKIPVGNLTISGKKLINVPHTLVLYPTDTAGNISEMGILDDDFVTATTIQGDDAVYFIMGETMYENLIPNAKAVRTALDYTLSLKQNVIPASGHWSTNNGAVYSSGDGSFDTDWLSVGVKGTGLVTRTSENGVVGERKIFEATDVANYHDSQLSANEQAIQDISIPTVGAMMTAITNGVSAAAPTGTPNTIANYGANGALGNGIATYDGSGTYNAATDAGKIATAAAVETKANHMTCAGWPESVPVNQRTDANCWLWNKN